MAKNDDLPGVDGPGVAPVKIKAVSDAFDDLLAHRQNGWRTAKKSKPVRKY